MRYTPKQGDIITINFSPQAGHEYKGRRPALIISNAEFHKRTNMAMVCPITSTISGFPTHITLGERTATKGEIICEQVKCLDIGARDADYKETAPDDTVERVIDMICSFIE